MKTDGDLIRAKVTKITPDDIEYKLFNNLDGPLYELPTVDIQKIDFENGTVQSFAEVHEESELTREELKNLIIENINKNGYTHSGQNRYRAEFENDLLKLTPQNQRGSDQGRPTLYELNGDCDFHKLSVRNSGTTYVNIVTYQVNGTREVDTTRRFSKPVIGQHTKLVIRFKNEKDAKIIRDAMIKYNESFQDAK